MGTSPDRTPDDDLALLASGKGNEFDEALRHALALVARGQKVSWPLWRIWQFVGDDGDRAANGAGE